MKLCLKCEQTKPVVEFYRDCTRPGGRHPYCKECQRRSASEYFRLHPEVNKRAVRRYKDSHREVLNRRSAEYALANPEKIRARSLANSARRHGRLVAPTVCGSCGKARKIRMHHEDYSKPLDVRWLCDVCHTQLHALEQGV
jgi:hypothetical protein